MALLFVHGAGGYVDDQPIADGLGALLGVDVVMPEFSDEDMSFEGWAAPLRKRLADLQPDDMVVAHSFGASILVAVLAERHREVPNRAVLLAMPDWTARGWDVAEYAFDGPGPDTDLSLHHCRDDEVVPFEHLALHRMGVHVAHPTGGHQFEGRLREIAEDVRRGA